MSLTRSTPLRRAEAHVLRCAMGMVNALGWGMFKDGNGHERVIYPGSMRRLEGAIARLKEARKAAKAKRPGKRKYL